MTEPTHNETNHHNSFVYLDEETVLANENDELLVVERSSSLEQWQTELALLRADFEKRRLIEIVTDGTVVARGSLKNLVPIDDDAIHHSNSWSVPLTMVDESESTTTSLESLIVRIGGLNVYKYKLSSTNHNDHHFILKDLTNVVPCDDSSRRPVFLVWPTALFAADMSENERSTRDHHDATSLLYNMDIDGRHLELDGLYLSLPNHVALDDFLGLSLYCIRFQTMTFASRGDQDTVPLNHLRTFGAFVSKNF